MSTEPADQSEEVIDSSKYIRTYAKDMAALSGQGGTKPVAAAPPPPPKTTTEDGVTLPKVDESLITQSRLRRDADETVDLTDTPSEGSVSVLEEKRPEPAPMPSPVSLTPNAGQEAESREAILARLKARAAQKEPAPTVTPAPQPAPPEPKAPERPAFTMPSFELPHLPDMPKMERPAPPAPPPPKPKPAPEKPERFHSYSTDFSERVDARGASTFSVLAAQADKPREVVRSRTASKQAPKPTAIIAGVLIVLGIGVVAVSLVYVLTRPQDVIVTQGVPSLIAADETMELEGTSAGELMRALSSAAEEPLVDGNVLVTYIASASSTPKGAPFSIPEQGGYLIKALPLQAPDILLRNIRPESTVGVVHAGSETRAFFILKVSSFERTFAGMLAWEGNMRNALIQLYPDYPNAPVIESVPLAATTTAPTTTPFVIPPPVVAPTMFVDAVVRNYDVRILRDAGGRSLILYGYKDKETLIIARDEAAFMELVNRLNASGK